MVQLDLYDETREVLLKTHKFCNLPGTVFTKSCLLSRKTTCHERPQNRVVASYRFHCVSIANALEIPHIYRKPEISWWFTYAWVLVFFQQVELGTNRQQCSVLFVSFKYLNELVSSFIICTSLWLFLTWHSWFPDYRLISFDRSLMKVVVHISQVKILNEFKFQYCHSLIHLPLVPHICISESGQHWFI